MWKIIVNKPKNFITHAKTIKNGGSKVCFRLNLCNKINSSNVRITNLHSSYAHVHAK